MKILFAGTPEFASAHLSALLACDRHSVCAVLTQPDRPAGRGKRLQSSPVKQCAEAAGRLVLQPASLRKADIQATLRDLKADVMVVVAYGLILPQTVLEIPALGCLNVHASLLPRWRGAAPIQRAIEAGDRTSGITIMQMDAGLDTGAMLAHAQCPIDAETTAGLLHDRLAELGPPLLLSVLDTLPAHQAGAATQDDAGANYASKISKSEADIDWHQPAELLARRIRAFNPFPVCFSFLGEERVRIWHATPQADGSGEPGCVIESSEQGITVACGTGALQLLELQFPGGRRLAAAELLKSRADRLSPGAHFSQDPN